VPAVCTVSVPAAVVSTSAPPTVKAACAASARDGVLLPASPDVVMVLAFSAIMLNTDAHNPAVKRERKMTRAGFVGNNRGIDAGGGDKQAPHESPVASESGKGSKGGSGGRVNS
jgi:hypothetical protein